MNYTFFWNGVFSQWYPSTFNDGQRTYNCAEQYMMYHKAMTFNDTYTANKIMATDNPREQKKLGRLVQNFNAAKWDQVKFDIVLEGNRLKFTQNDDLLEELIKTGDTEMVEASPYDKIWGVGLSEDDPRIHNKENWQGENLLGKVLDQVRLEIEMTL